MVSGLVVGAILVTVIMMMTSNKPDEIQRGDVKELLREQGIELTFLGDPPRRIGVSPQEAAESAAEIFHAVPEQNPNVALARVTENRSEPEFLGHFYVLELEGYGAGPIMSKRTRPYLVLIDARDGSQTMGFDLEREL